MKTVIMAAIKAANKTGCDLQNFSIFEVKFNTTFFYFRSCQNATALAAATLSESTPLYIGIFTV